MISAVTKFPLLAAALAAGIFTATFASPRSANAEFKLATVDVNKLLNDSNEAKGKRKDLDEKAAAARKKLEDRGKALRDRKAKLDAAEDKADPKEVEKFRADARDFDRDLKDTDEDLKKEFLKVNHVLAEKAVKLVSEYAKKNQIDLVLDKGQASRGPVLFGQPTFDITGEILSEMNHS